MSVGKTEQTGTISLRPKSAQEFWSDPSSPTKCSLRRDGKYPERKVDHPDYMDFAEEYADYLVAFEKRNS